MEPQCMPARRMPSPMVAGFVVVAALGCAGGVLGSSHYRTLRKAIPRSTLWDVVEACKVDQRLAGVPFPCQQVVPSEEGRPGHVLLRPPTRRTHVVLVPTRRVTGVEQVVGPALDGGGYLREAWAARPEVEAALGRAAAVGIAVNSAITRSQDQLHMHVDCVDGPVAFALAEQAPAIPKDGWKAGGFNWAGQAFWARLMTAADLATKDPFRLASEIPAVREEPSRTVMAMLPVEVAGADEIALLVAQSDPRLEKNQFTSERLLDHSCGR